MTHCATMPLLVVAAVESNGSRRGCLGQLKRKLKQRGLKVQSLEASHDPVTSDCDVLLVSCRGRQVDALAQELELLWTQKWNRWYAEARHA